MNACTQSCDPSPDMEEVWRRSLIRVTDEFTLPSVVLRVDDAIIGTLGNFSVSTGKAKAKKTFNVCALVAAALINGQVLEYRASFPETKRNILYFDTEQSPYHCQLVMQRILHLAGLPLDREPEHLHFSHLRAIAEPEIRRAIIRYAIYHTPDVGLVIIDGIRDLMYGINSSTEATKLVGDLMQWTGEQNIHIQRNLHLNKGDDKARGHIGTELNNKAESVLLIARDNADADEASYPLRSFAQRLFSHLLSGYQKTKASAYQSWTAIIPSYTHKLSLTKNSPMRSTAKPYERCSVRIPN